MFTTMSYNKPFLITYLCTSTFSLYLVRPLYSYLRRRTSNEKDAVSSANGRRLSGAQSTETLK